MIADLDTLLIALYVELTDRIIPSRGPARCGPGRPRDVTDAELVCLSVAQVLLRHDDERFWLRAAPKLAGHLFPQLLGQSEYNERLKASAPLMEAALRWIAEATPGSGELLRLMDGTPVPCGQSVVTAKRSDMAGYAGYGYCASHSRFYWGAKLLLIITCDGTVTGFALASPKLDGERETVRVMLGRQPANRPARGTAVVADKGFAEGGLRGIPGRGRPGPGPGPPGPQERGDRVPVPELAAAARRGRHLDAEEPARPRTPRRTRSRRTMGQGRPAPARPQRRHLVQLDDRRPGQAVPDRLRPRVTCPHFPVNDLSSTRGPGGRRAGCRSLRPAARRAG
jgi:hypothetical protein